jgi:hypothetical protein
MSERAAGVLRRWAKRREHAEYPDRLDHWSRTAALLGEAERFHPGQRPNYAWGVLHAAGVARHLHLPAITAVEMGVAGGNGLVALELAAEAAYELTGVSVEVHGFDTGRGLPTPVDHRDAPYLARAGEFPMDEARLRARLRHARLHVGDVRDQIPAFLAAGPAPVGFASFDLDFHSSTEGALTLFDADSDRLLPRVLCYVDDSIGYPWGDTNGARLAIREFNESRTRAVDHLPGMRHLVPASEFDARWTEALYLAHVYDHPRYAEDEGTSFGSSLELAE